MEGYTETNQWFSQGEDMRTEQIRNEFGQEHTFVCESFHILGILNHVKT